RGRAPADGAHELPARDPAAGGHAAPVCALRQPAEWSDAGAPAELRRLSHHRGRWRRLLEAGGGSVARPPAADAGRGARAIGLAVCVSPRADHYSAMAERADADIRTGI